MRPRRHHHRLEGQLVIDMDVADKGRQHGRGLSLGDDLPQRGVQRPARRFDEARGGQVKPQGLPDTENGVSLLGFVPHLGDVRCRVVGRLPGRHDCHDDMQPAFASRAMVPPAPSISSSG